MYNTDMASSERSSGLGDSAVAGSGPPLTYLVEGMDCANCVRGVERMVAGLPGTSAVQTSFTRQTLSLALDESRTPRAVLEGNLRALGYVPSLRGTVGAATTPLQEHDHSGHAHAGHDHGHGEGHGHDHAAVPGQAWYAGTQGRLVLGSGALLALAWTFGFFEPALATWGYVAATLLGVWPLARRAWASARLGEPFSINMLVTVAALGALLIGEAPEGAVVVFFFAVGELLEGVAAGRARAGIQALAALTPRTALLLEGEGTREVPAASLGVGQTVQVRPGDRIPADGLILSGRSGVDDSPVTGESVPVFKAEGDAVYAGSINTDGVLTVRVERAAQDNTIARIIALVEEAESSRAPTARFIDRFSRVYTPAVVLVAALVATVPPLTLGADWNTWLYRGLALLLIGCPCALVLSVPAALTSAISAGTRRGLLVKGGAALEKLGSSRLVALDKTGTLTAGRPRVTDIAAFGTGRAEVLRLAAATESGSSHPLARAVLAAAAEEGLTLPTAQDAQAQAGRAVTATVEGRTLSVGSPRHAAEQAQAAGQTLPAEVQAQIAAFEAQGRTAVVLQDGAVCLGVLALRDEPRPDARATLARLRALGVRPLMLTGDNARTAQAIADDLGLAAGDVRAELLPADKLRLITGLRDSHEGRAGVAMVGDGINDAPALAQADVGIAMGGGTDVALEAADAALLRGRLAGVAELIELSRAAMVNIRVNIALALGLKLVFLVTTLLGSTNLWMAILADTGATALVTANALRLLRWRPREDAVVAQPPMPAGTRLT